MKRKSTNKIIVHCAYTPAGKYFDIEDIRKWHVEENGWKDVGYHFIVLLDGTIQIGRDIDEIGAHVRGHNIDSVGICYIGGKDYCNKKSKDTRTKAQKETLVDLIKVLKKIYTEAKVYGHNDFDKRKTCPCFDAKTEYED